MTSQPPRLASPVIPRPPPELRLGLCARPGADPALWASAVPSRRAYAAAICAHCPALTPCLAYGLTVPADRLIWGGLGAAERRAVTRARQRALDAALAPHPAAA
jgi:hypothetical protein